MGVVIFVLALTILGISLFSLSGYEAQFISASHRRSQLFYDAMSGIERTKYVLATSGQLDAVASDLPLPGLPSLVMAQAVQNGESTGTVSWSPDKKIEIRVRAERPGNPSENVTLHASYTPLDKRTLYRNTIESSRSLAVYDSTGADTTIWINGGIRLNFNNNFAWDDFIRGSHAYSEGGVPDPDIADFISHWMPQTSGPPVRTRSSNPERTTYRFDLSADVPVKVFDGPYAGFGPVHDNELHPMFGFSDGDDPHIEIMIDGARGTNQTLIWLLPKGAHFAETVTVTGAWNTNLVIVAGTSECDTLMTEVGSNLGLWFESGLRSENVRLFLVSTGSAAIGRKRNPVVSMRAGYITIFSSGVYLRGPREAPEYLILEKTSDDTFLDELYDGGYLPNTFGRNREFELVSGSFQEINISY